MLSVITILAVPGDPANAAGSVTLSQSTPGTILLTGQSSYTFTIANGGPDDLFNTSVLEKLPAGVSYVAGSTSPAQFGNPVVTKDSVTGITSLFWQNVQDVPAGGSFILGFSLTVDPTVDPVGTTFSGQASVYANTNPRIMPYQTASQMISGYTDTASGQNPTITVSALNVAKAQPSPEGKYLRGAHTQTQPYTLTISNNNKYPTTGVTVTDYIPAGLEFLGAGTIDNSLAQEYPGSGPLAGTAGSSPIVPTSVDTVTNPVGYPAGIYTQVTWAIGDLGIGEIKSITYATGIPLFENSTWASGAEPTPASLGQISNLDNNTGASTRQVGNGIGLTNHVEVNGTYTGPVADGATTAISAKASTGIVAKDVRIRKALTQNDDGSTNSQFIPGRIATYSLTVDVSEYVDASNIVLTDTLPNGFCPVPDGGLADAAIAGLSDCLASSPSGPAVTGGSYNSVTRNADGTFTLVFNALTVAANGTATITYQALERASYTGGALAGKPTVAGDSFENKVSLSAQTTAIPATGVTPAVQTVTNSDSARNFTTAPTIAKKILPASTPNYASGVGTYITPNASTPASDTTFMEGDVIWFQLVVNFPQNLNTRHIIVDDYLPIGSTYLNGSYQQIKQNVADEDWVLDTSNSTSTFLEWKPASSQPDGSDFTPGGGTVTLQIAVTVQSAAPIEADLVTGNLMKVHTENSLGAPVELRTKIDYTVKSPPSLSITKNVTAVNGLPAVGSPNVRANDIVSYDVVVNNQSATDTIDNVAVWDVLPTGITSSNVISSGGGTVTDPSSPTQPTFAQRATRSAIVWSGPVSIPPLGTQTYSIQLQIPGTTSTATVFDNLASIRSFAALNNQGSDTTYYPQLNVDTSVPVSEQNAQAATANATVSTPPVLLFLSTSQTGINETNNDLVNQATIGELVTYTASLTIPAMTNVYGGAFSAAIPVGVQPSGTPTMMLDGVAVNYVTSLPGDQTVTASLGAVYSNTTNVDQVFTLTYQGYVLDIPANVQGKTLVNNARFTSNNSFDQSISLPEITSSYTTTVVLPVPALTKKNNSVSNTVKAGQVITYTLTPGNSVGRPALRNATVTDTIPAGLTLVPGSLTSVPAAAATFGAPVSNPDGTTTISAVFAPNIISGSTAAVTYQAVVSSQASAAQVYANHASLSGLTVNAADAQPGPARTLTATATNSVTVASPTVAKTAANPQRTIGQSNTFTVTMTVPSSVNVYGATIVDQLPAHVTFGATTSVTVSTGGGPNVAITPLSELTPSGFHAWVIGDIVESPSVRVYTVTYTTTVNNDSQNVAGGSLTNTATARWNLVSGSQPTAVTGFDKTSATARATMTITEPKPTITKTVSTASPQPGDIFGYTMTIGTATGTSVSAAYNLTVVDNVPAGVVPDPATISAGGVFNALTRTITWNIAGPTNPASPISLTYNATLAASTTLTTGTTLSSSGSITSYASLSSGGRIYSTPISASASVSPVFPSVAPSKSAVLNTPAIIGAPFAWTISALNSGAGTAQTITMTDTLPTGWTYQPGSATLAGFGPLEPSVSGTTLIWIINAPYSNGQRASITYSAVPTVAAYNTLGSAFQQTNRVSVSATDNTGSDRNASRTYGTGQATANANIPVSDIRLAKTHIGSFVSGAVNIWRLTVSNAGPDASTGVFTVTDTLPSGVSFVSLDTTTGWSLVSNVGQVATFAHASATIASGSSLPPLQISVNTPADSANGTSFTNSATVSGGTNYDPVPANNTATDTATVELSSDLVIVKSVSGTAVAGNPLTWNLDVSNAGPSASQGTITVTDTLPAGVTFVSANAPGWNVTINGQVVTATRDDSIAVHTPASRIAILTQLDSSLTGTLSNTATVSATPIDPDPQPGNNSSTSTVPVSATASLAVQKTHLGTFTAGTVGQYEFTVFNNGPSDAQQVTLTDALPAGITYAENISSSLTWNVTGTSPLTLELSGALAAGQSAQVVVDVNIDPGLDLTAGVTNTVVATSSTAPLPAQNSDNTLVTGEADLAITKSHVGDAVAGQAVTYTLSIENLGPSTTDGPITVEDIFPDGLTFDSFTGTGWTHTVVGGVDTFVSTTNIAPGGSAEPILVTANVDPAAGGTTLVNTANVQGILTDPVLVNNTAADPTIVKSFATLTIVKSTVSSPVVAGTNANYTITVTNQGPSVASNVTLTDPLLPELSLVSATADNPALWDKQAGVTFFAPELPIGTSTFNVVAQVNSSVLDGTVLTNTSSTTSTTPPSLREVAQEVSASANVTVAAVADLSAVKHHIGTGVIAGENATYTIQVNNAGPSTAAGPIRVEDTLPAGFSLGSVSSDWDVVSTSPLIFELSGGVSLASGADAPLLTVVALTDSSLRAGPVVNTATVSSPTIDPNTLNNAGLDTIEVSDLANLSITKQAQASASIGSELPYTISVSNAGPSSADDVVVTDTLPAGLSYVDTPSTGWNITEVGGVVTATLMSALAPGATAPPLVISTVVTPGAYPVVTNTATVTTSTPQADSDKKASVEVAVPPLVDLSITKSHVGDFYVGRTGTYTVTVTNNGPTIAPSGFSVQDDLPTPFTLISAEGVGWSVGSGPGALTMDYAGPLGVGESVSFTVEVEVTPASGPQETNVVTVSTKDPDENTSDLTAEDPTIVIPVADLAIMKTLTNNPTIKGTAVFSLATSNLGPSTAENVVVTDVLPIGLTYISADGGPDWTINTSISSDPVEPRWTITATYSGSLSAGAAAPAIIVTTRVDPNAFPEISNTASVTSATFDPELANNASTASSSIPELVDLALVKTHEGDLTVGSATVYDFEVSNNGPLTESGPITITDALPAGLTADALLSSGWQMQMNGGTLELVSDHGLAVGASETVRVKLMVGPASYPRVSNTATVTSANADDSSGNNTSTDIADVPPLAGMKVAKSVLESTPGKVTWKIDVTNNGPTIEPDGFSVSDILPSQLSFVSAVGTGWVIEGAGQTVTAEHADGLAVNDVSSFIVTTSYMPGASEERITNTVELTYETNLHDTASASVNLDKKPEAPRDPGTLPGHLLAVTGWSGSGGTSLWALGLLAIGLLIRRRRRKNAARF